MKKNNLENEFKLIINFYFSNFPLAFLINFKLKDQGSERPQSGEKTQVWMKGKARTILLRLCSVFHTSNDW